MNDADVAFKLRDTIGRGIDLMEGNGKHYAEIEVEMITPDQQIEDIVRVRAVGNHLEQEFQIRWEDETYKDDQRVLYLLEKGAHLVKKELENSLNW